MTGGSAEVDVRALAAGGSGVADLPDGRVVFVPRTAPGDRALIRIEKSKPRWAVGALDRLIEPASDRVDAPCPVYPICGGCQLQHLPYERQVAAKGEFVADALQRIGGLTDVDAPEVVPSPHPFHYRSRMTFTLRRLRGGRVVAGLHALGRPAHVIDVHGECLLPYPELVSAWTRLRGAWGKGARLLPDGGRLRITVRSVGHGIGVVVQGGSARWDARPLLEAAGGLVAIWHERGTGEEGPILVAGDEPEHGPAFEQVNPDVASMLAAYVLDEAVVAAEEVGTAGDRRTAVDAYSGFGGYGRALAERGWAVTAIEADAVAAAGAAMRSPPGFEVVEGRVEDHLPPLLPVDLLVVNPPRAGLHADVVEAIGGAPPDSLVYVSCDPGTLARDLRALTHLYDLAAMRAFDLFPQTAHVETVVALSRKGEDG